MHVRKIEGPYGEQIKPGDRVINKEEKKQVIKEAAKTQNKTKPNKTNRPTLGSPVTITLIPLPKKVGKHWLIELYGLNPDSILKPQKET